jgi:coenzyme F420 biosynthesis associated uncharacterized protein
MVDWSLARQIARFAAGDAQSPDLRSELRRMVPDAAEDVAGYTRLEAAGRLPAPEQVNRRDWAEVNLSALSELLDPVGQRLDERLGAAGPLAGALRAAGGATLAAEVGLVLGYMSQRVLGQYEISLIQPDPRPRLLFVSPNLTAAAEQMQVPREPFVHWVVLHELTHAFQFAGVPWLREHLGGLLREYLATVEVRIERGAAGGLPSLPDPARIIELFREGGLAALVQSREQRAIMDRIQAAMAVVEGYSEHVMDAVGADVVDGYEGLREAMERRRRSRSAPERILQRLLGLDRKLEQYELGHRFCDAVVERGGIEALNRVWGSPAALPARRELDQPQEWFERLADTAVTPA